MKKTLIAFLLTFSVFQCYSQTTVDEWNYITKGYKIQKESGLDMKKGYELVFVTSANFQDPGVLRTFIFKKLIKISDKKVHAIMVEYMFQNRRGTAINYFCIPLKNSSPEIWGMVANEIRRFTNQDLSTAYNWALIKYITDNQ